MTNQSIAPDLEQPFKLLVTYVDLHDTKQLSHQPPPAFNKEYFAFRVGTINLLIELKKVSEIIKSMFKVTPLPFSPNWLLGIGGLRGEVYSVIDLRTLLHIQSKKYDKEVAYLVLGQSAQGYILKINEIVGIRDCVLTQSTPEQTFFDAQGDINGEVYYRLDVDKLISDAPFADEKR